MFIKQEECEDSNDIIGETEEVGASVAIGGKKENDSLTGASDISRFQDCQDLLQSWRNSTRNGCLMDCGIGSRTV